MVIYKIFLNKKNVMDVRNILILSMVKGIGPAFIKRNYSRLLQGVSCEQLVLEVKAKELDVLGDYARAAEEIITCCNTNGIIPISILDAEYPKQLMEIADPPSVLFVKGNIDLMKRVVAIVGTRKSSNLGNRIAERLGAYFSQHFSICNGLVEGIDEHSVYNNGKILPNVVGVISGGLCYNETCSAHHRSIIEDVLSAGGLIVSEYFPRQKEDKFSGSKASRIQAGLSHGLILVQSKTDGGSKYTLEKFAKLGRPMGIIHYPSSDEYNSDSFGANRLIIEKGMLGLSQLLDLKKTSSINSGRIIALTNKDDYEELIQEIKFQESNILF